MLSSAPFNIQITFLCPFCENTYGSLIWDNKFNQPMIILVLDSIHPVGMNSIWNMNQQKKKSIKLIIWIPDIIPSKKNPFSNIDHLLNFFPHLWYIEGRNWKYFVWFIFKNMKIIHFQIHYSWYKRDINWKKNYIHIYILILNQPLFYFISLYLLSKFSHFRKSLLWYIINSKLVLKFVFFFSFFFISPFPLYLVFSKFARSNHSLNCHV